MRALLVLLALACAAPRAGADEAAAALARTEARLARAMGELHALDARLAEARRALLETERALAAARREHARAVRERERARKRLAAAKKDLLLAVRSAWMRASPAPAWLAGDLSEAAHRRVLLRAVLRWQRQALARWQRAYHEAERAERRARQARERLERERRRHAQAVAALRRERQAKRRWIARLRRRRAALEAALRAQQQALARAMLAPEERALQVHRAPAPGTLRWPVRGRVRIRFGQPAPPLGRPADGIFVRPAGDVVRAAAAGRVRYAGWFGGMGLALVLDHGHGIWTIYAHNEALLVHAGDWVEAGEPIARAGATGWVADTTLYFGLRRRGRAVDPLRWLARAGGDRGGGR